MRLRADDPVGMKNFISSVQSRVTELKASSEESQSNISSKRVRIIQSIGVDSYFSVIHLCIDLLDVIADGIYA